MEHWYHYIHSIETTWAQRVLSTFFIETNNVNKGRLLDRCSSVRSQLTGINWSELRTLSAWDVNYDLQVLIHQHSFESCQGLKTPSVYLLLNYKRGSWSFCWWKIYVAAVLSVLLFGYKTWEWSSSMLQTIRRFHHCAVWRFAKYYGKNWYFFLVLSKLFFFPVQLLLGNEINGVRLLQDQSHVVSFIWPFTIIKLLCVSQDWFHETQDRNNTVLTYNVKANESSIEIY